ncbi:probable serine/threonine-protein kinase clkA [Chrysoperla carnea]|uniref:probable serine/threonine-protein kinase clkA n=1 Tax=Chrysoperla carnea TaxID=189513 RepID=UPI001D09545B|nr:probable serine/threonine-protein kinase clkA [Chrysoperla carnea]
MSSYMIFKHNRNNYRSNGSNDKHLNNNRNKRLNNNNRIQPYSRHINLAMDSTTPFNHYYCNRRQKSKNEHDRRIGGGPITNKTEYHDDNERENSNYSVKAFSSKRFKSVSPINSWCSYADFEVNQRISESIRIRNDEELSESSSVQCLDSIHGSRTVIDLISVGNNEEISTDDFKLKSTEEDFNDKSSSPNQEKDKDLINAKNELKKFDDILSKYQMNLNKISETPLSYEDHKIIEEYLNIIISMEEDSRIKEIR